MAYEPKLQGLRKWFKGDRSAPLRFSDLWRLLLVNLAERAEKKLDEERRPIAGGIDWFSYSYDLALVAEEEEIFVSQNDIQRVASHFEQHGWATFSRRAPVKLRITAAAIEEAHRVLSDMDAVVFTIAHSTNPPDEADVPASDRFVQLNDNSPSYSAAIESLQELIREAGAIRTNDWPEKEGIVETFKAVMNMIQSRYVNKRALLTMMSTAVGFVVLKFAESPIADLANRTWTAVKALF